MKTLFPYIRHTPKLNLVSEVGLNSYLRMIIGNSENGSQSILKIIIVNSNPRVYLFSGV